MTAPSPSWARLVGSSSVLGTSPGALSASTLSRLVSTMKCRTSSSTASGDTQRRRNQTHRRSMAPWAANWNGSSRFSRQIRATRAREARLAGRWSQRWVQRRRSRASSSTTRGSKRGSGMVDLLELEGVQAGHDLRRLDDALGGRPVHHRGPQDLAEQLEVVVVVGAVVAQESDLVVVEAEPGLEQLGPAQRLGRAEALDHEHGPEQVDRVGLAGLVEDERRQGLAADVLGGLPDLLQGAADGHVVLLQQLEVAVLLAGVEDEGAAQAEQRGRHAGGGPGDPAAAVDDLLAQVEQQPAGDLAVVGGRLAQRRGGGRRRARDGRDRGSGGPGPFRAVPGDAG